MAPDNARESTKERILNASAKLFSQNGYSEVSMRDIAREVGIKAASIYNHFDSKKAIRDTLFEFYDAQWTAAEPNVDELLRLAEDEPPDVVLMKMLFDWDTPEMQTLMNRIYVIASREAMINPDGIDLIKNLVIERVKVLPRAILQHLSDLGKIEPMDIEAFLIILSHVSHSSTVLNLTPLRINLEEWYRCWVMLLSLVKPTGK